MTEITPVQRARMAAAAEALATGKVRIPLSCGFCQASYVVDDGLNGDGERVLNCGSCGRVTRLSTAHAIRKQKIKAFIRQGIDVPLAAKDRR